TLLTRTLTPPLSLHDALPISMCSPVSIAANASASSSGISGKHRPQRTINDCRISDSCGKITYLPLCLKEAGVSNSIGKRLSSVRSEEHTSELQSRFDLVCRLL